MYLQISISVLFRNCDYDLIWRVFADDQEKMNALGWALIQCLCPSQKGKFEHKDTYTEKKYHVETVIMLPLAKKHQRLPEKQKLEDRHEVGSLWKETILTFRTERQ